MEMAIGYTQRLGANAMLSTFIDYTCKCFDRPPKKMTQLLTQIQINLTESLTPQA